jgi:hypothetical protein
MPAEDRDRLFEKALARHLRNDAAARDHSACPDAERLAAYHERLLALEEMSATKNHVVSCVRCQEILAQLEAPQAVNELQNLEENRVAGGALSRGVENEMAKETSAAVPVAAPGKKRVGVLPFHTKKSSRLRWAAPAGAIAAGLLLWIGIRENRSPISEKSEPAVQIAENRSDAPQTPPAQSAETEAVTRQKSENLGREELKEQPRAPDSTVLRDEFDNSRKMAPSAAPMSADKKASSSVSLVPSKPVNPELQSENRASPAEAGKVTPKPEKSDVTSQSAPLDFSQVTTRDIQNNGSKQQMVAGMVSQPATPQASPSRTKAGQPQSGTAEAGGASSLILNKDVNERAVYNNAFLNVGALSSVAAAPDGKSIWRFGEHGTIAHSADGGKTWESQAAALTSTLTSGSAPSKKVCWIAGSAGTLLRTTDGGKHWRLVTTPIVTDLGGVRASDAKHALIWDLPNRLSYETSDSGLTWKQIANQ